MNAKEKHDDYDKKWLGELCVGRKKYRMKSGEGKYIKEKVIIIAIAKDVNEQQTTSHMWQVKTNYLWKKKNGEQQLGTYIPYALYHTEVDRTEDLYRECDEAENKLNLRDMTGKTGKVFYKSMGRILKTG